jgi:hypothetical protein
LEVFHAACPASVAFPLHALFLFAFRRFSFGELNFYFESRRDAYTVLIRSSNRSLFGNCDSSRLETCLNYFTRFGTVSHRPSPPVPHSHLARANAPEGPVNFASPAGPFGQFKRSRANQPNPTIPRSPGIILETCDINLSIATARFVLSMNCKHHSNFFHSYNKLI